MSGRLRYLWTVHHEIGPVMIRPAPHPRPGLLARRTVLAGLAGLSLSGFRSLEGLFAPSAKLWPRWEAHDPDSTRELDWSAYDAWLADHVHPSTEGINLVDYGGVSASGKATLDAIVADLAAVEVSTLNRDEQFAFWVNLYNAVTLKTVLEHYPIASIHGIDLPGDIVSDGPWKAKLVTVEGQELSLDEIEHRILRPIWRDARVHYAVNCAALGCPNLRERAWRAETLNADLDAAARAYINHPRGVHVRTEAGRPHLIISKIYDWFAEDFGRSEASVLTHLRTYGEGETAAILAEINHIHDTTYDWSLNDLKTVR